MQAMDMTGAVARAQVEDRLAKAREARRARVASRVEALPEPDEVVIRLARPADDRRLGTLRDLDGKPRTWPGSGDVLVALTDGALAAAVPLERPGDVAADPFRRTESIVRLLETRARQVRRPLTHHGMGRLPRLVRAR